MQVQFIAVSQNAKTGPIPASIVERASCWPGCALYENGCYAENGALGMHWDRVSRGLAGGSWSEFCAKVAALRPGRLWRYAQAGDLPGYGPLIDGTLLEELVAANAGKNVIAFTHKPVLGDDPVAGENRRLIARPSRPASRSISRPTTPRMRTAWPSRACPRRDRPGPELSARRRSASAQRRPDQWAETIDEWRDRTARQPRRQVEAAIAARDVPAGESWAFRDHRTIAEVVAEEAV